MILVFSQKTEYWIDTIAKTKVHVYPTAAIAAAMWQCTGIHWCPLYTINPSSMCSCHTIISSLSQWPIWKVLMFWDCVLAIEQPVWNSVQWLTVQIVSCSWWIFTITAILQHDPVSKLSSFSLAYKDEIWGIMCEFDHVLPQSLLCCIITMTSHRHPGIPDHWELDGLFSSFSRLMIKETSELCTTHPLCGD